MLLYWVDRPENIQENRMERGASCSALRVEVFGIIIMDVQLCECTCILSGYEYMYPGYIYTNTI